VNILLDTHALLWFVGGDSRLSNKARRAIENPAHQSFISMVSCWEMAVKISLNKLDLGETLESFIDQRLDEGFQILPIELHHMTPLITLPFHHRDPFDRLLICQAVMEKMPVCTSDPHFSSYSASLLW
jgi:PIN domain nuclease of toxin-antitoxin system